MAISVEECLLLLCFAIYDTLDSHLYFSLFLLSHLFRLAPDRNHFDLEQILLVSLLRLRVEAELSWHLSDLEFLILALLRHF